MPVNVPLNCCYFTFVLCLAYNFHDECNTRVSLFFSSTQVTLTGLSALFQAANGNHLDAARILVAHGASPMATGRRLRRGSLCCVAHNNQHPHLDLHPLFAAVENNNLAMISLLLVASPTMPYWELVELRNIIFRTKYASEARLSDVVVVKFGFLFSGLLSRPRSLVDECRGVIRDAICFGRECSGRECGDGQRAAGSGKRPTLSEAVDQLPIPEGLKNFIMLRDEAILRPNVARVG